jgi:APA family basic amino acid/polyamine antiporter
MYGQTRIFYTMARDGLLPRVFSTVHPKYRTPWVNTLLVGVIVALAGGIFDINSLGDMTSVGTLAAFAVVCLSVIWLRRTHPDIPRGYKVPLYPIVPALGILSCLWLITTVPNYVLLIFAGYTGVMIVLYFLYGVHNSELGKGHPVIADEETPYFPEDAPRDASGKPVIRP